MNLSCFELFTVAVTILNLFVTLIIYKIVKRKSAQQKIQNVKTWHIQLIFSWTLLAFILGYTAWRILSRQHLYMNETTPIIFAGLVLSWAVAYLVIWIRQKRSGQ